MVWFFPKLLGRRHESIEVLNPHFSDVRVKNSKFSVCLKKVENWPILYKMRQRMEFHFKARIHALSEIQKFWQNFWTFRKTCKSQFWLVFHKNQKTRTLMDTWRLPKSLGKRNSMNTFDYIGVIKHSNFYRIRTYVI